MSNVYIFYMILSYILLIFINLAHVHATPIQSGNVPSEFKEGSYSLGMETTYLTTSANYTERGTSLDFDADYGFSAFQSHLYGRYDFSNQLSVFSALPLNYAMSENTTDNRSTFKASGMFAGINYDFQNYNFKIISQISAYYALEKFDRSSDDVLTSNGASYLDIGSHFFKDFSNFQFHGFLSYQYRMDGFSGLLNYQTDLSYLMQSSSITFGLKGFQTVADDENTDNPTYRHGYLTSVNGSSLIYGSVNPSRLDLFTQIEFTLSDSIKMYGAIDKSIRGENSGDILAFTVGLEYFFETLESQKNKYQYKSQEHFESEDEKIDPVIEEKIKSYNKPVKKKSKPIKRKPKPKPVPRKTKVPKKNLKAGKSDLVISKKQLGKKTSSTSPIKSKPKSKKPKRVRIDF